jgi:hypothetical protein
MTDHIISIKVPKSQVPKLGTGKYAFGPNTDGVMINVLALPFLPMHILVAAANQLCLKLDLRDQAVRNFLGFWIPVDQNLYEFTRELLSQYIDIALRVWNSEILDPTKTGTLIVEGIQLDERTVAFRKYVNGRNTLNQEFKDGKLIQESFLFGAYYERIREDGIFRNDNIGYYYYEIEKHNDSQVTITFENREFYGHWLRISKYKSELAGQVLREICGSAEIPLIQQIICEYL